MIIILMLWGALFAQQLPPKPTLSQPSAATAGKSLEKSAYFAFVDREYIFTLEVA